MQRGSLMSRFIDRRLNGKNKSAVNRQRFIRRFRQQIKKAVDSAIQNRHITDIEAGEHIVIPAKDVKEYQFRYGKGGIVKSILPGNRQFVEGDKIPKPVIGGQGTGGSEASNTGEGLDDFVFEISSDEFLEIFFEDLELPDLVKKHLARTTHFKTIRAGFSSTGVPANINIIRSMKGATARRIALTAPYRKQLKELESQLATKNPSTIEYSLLLNEISKLKRKILAIPFIDTFDLRYNLRVKQPIPSTQAVMFCIMDVSGSMDKVKKDIAKRFFILLYLFLQKNYQKVELVFIRHHTTAKEVDEKEFFYSRETGGTVVSSALNLMNEIIQSKYNPIDWNIYAAQASDGDNWNADSPICGTILRQQIMPKVQYFSYVEIMPRLHQSLWEVYSELKAENNNFAMKTISDYQDIYPVFRELFKRQIA